MSIPRHRPTPTMAKVLVAISNGATVHDYGDDKLCMGGRESRFWVGSDPVRTSTIEGLVSRGLLKRETIEAAEDWE